MGRLSMCSGTPPVDPGCNDGDCSNGIETWDGCQCIRHAARRSRL
ncbi:MAG: hypothetical protein R2798_07850 [Chitinophagales bacterium]